MILPQLSGLLVAVWCLLAPCSSSGAEMLPIFGPVKFIRGTGAPQELMQSFQNCEVAAQYKLVVLNGDQDGARRVSSATISLNGAKVIGPSDFNQQVARIERPVAVLTNNRLSVRLTSQAGSLLTLSVECLANCLDVRITSPVPQATVNRSSMTVTGTVTSSSDEIGVTVNGVVAHVQGSAFAAAPVPLTLGTIPVTATATNACFNRATASISLNTLQFSDVPIRILATPTAGIEPLRVTLEAIVNLPAAPTNYQWDFEGTGTVGASGANASQVEHTYAAGLFLPTVTVTDAQGNRLAQSAVLSVFTFRQIDSLLKSRWQSLKAAFASGDIGRATDLIDPLVSWRYQRMFRALSSRLPTISSDLSDIAFVSLRGGVAEYATIRRRDNEPFVFLIEFVRDQNGLWRIGGL